MTTDTPEAALERTIVTAVGDTQVRAVRIFDAPRERVFDLYLDPAHVNDWWGPARYTNIVHEMDVRPGGRWKIESTAGDEVHMFHGEYREVERPSRVVQTFVWGGAPEAELVDTVEFEELPGGRTRLVILSTSPTREARDGMLSAGMEGGMNEGHDRFAELLRNRQ
jgi:uncharacterized protein YndB with AHSA1/START domain